MRRLSLVAGYIFLFAGLWLLLVASHTGFTADEDILTLGSFEETVALDIAKDRLPVTGKSGGVEVSTPVLEPREDDPNDGKCLVVRYQGGKKGRYFYWEWRSLFADISFGDTFTFWIYVSHPMSLTFTIAEPGAGALTANGRIRLDKMGWHKIVIRKADLSVSSTSRPFNWARIYSIRFTLDFQTDELHDGEVKLDNFYLSYTPVLELGTSQKLIESPRGEGRELKGDGGAPSSTFGFKPVIVEATLNPASAYPGQRVNLSYTVANLGAEPAREDLRFLVHVSPAGNPGKIITGADHDPLLPTSCWTSGGVYRGEVSLRLPFPLPPGEYDVFIGLYSRLSGERVNFNNADLLKESSRCKIGTISIEPGDSDSTKRLCEYRSQPEFSGQLAPAMITYNAPDAITYADEDLVIETSRINAVFRKDTPAPRYISWKGTDRKVDGAPGGSGPEVLLYNLREGKFFWSYGKGVAFEISGEMQGNAILYHVLCKPASGGRVKFDLRYSAFGDEITLEMGNVEESGDLRLIRVRTPLVVSVSGAAPRTGLVVPTGGGLVLPLTEEVPSLRKMIALDVAERNVIVAAGLFYGTLGAGIWSWGLDDAVGCEVFGYRDREQGKGAGLFAEFSYRLNSLVAGEPLRTGGLHRVSLVLADEPEGREDAPWTIPMKALRRFVPDNFNPLYAGALVYKFLIDSGRGQGVNSFDNALECIKEVYNLTGGARQIVYLVGWQDGGHDHGYPAINKVNEKAGGREALLRLFSEASKYNAIVSFHDNYDDAYKDSPRWDEDIIAKTPGGDLLKGSVWAGGQSYIISPWRYVSSGKALRRVEETLSLYPIQYTYHIDVLSMIPRRYDFRSGSPADAIQNLAGKLAIVDAFRSRGIDVTSEGVSAPFLSHISYYHSASITSREGLLPGAHPVPVVLFMLHGNVSYSNGRDITEEGILFHLLNGAKVSADEDHISAPKNLLPAYFLVELPLSLTAHARVESYREDGDDILVGFENGATLRIFKTKGSYELEYQGKVVSRDFGSFIKRDDTWFAYGMRGEVYEFELPEELRGKKLTVSVLGPYGSRQLPEGMDEKPLVGWEVKGDIFRFKGGGFAYAVHPEE